jgi:hypothetical protein
MKKNLIVCPTRGRPEQFKRFYESFVQMSEISDLVFLIDHDDDKLKEYLSISEKCIINYEKKNTTQLLNLGFDLNPTYEFYTYINDDFVFKVFGWDFYLCAQGKISYGNDLLAGPNMPTCGVVDGEIVRALGWLQMPELKYQYGDAVWKTIGHKLNILKYHPSVIIEHKHWSNGKAQIDETYKRTNTTQVFQKDDRIYKDWLHNQCEEDLGRIRRRLGV